jgi:hypothetical protein
VVLLALALTGCGDGGSEPVNTPNPRRSPPPLSWVRGAYAGNAWVSHVVSADWQGSTMVVGTDLSASPKNEALGSGACTAFRAYTLFVKREAPVQVKAKDGTQLATC